MPRLRRGSPSARTAEELWSTRPKSVSRSAGESVKTGPVEFSGRGRGNGSEAGSTPAVDGRGLKVGVNLFPAQFNDDALVDKVDAALGGVRLSDKGGTLRQTVATSPGAEPNADPVRVSMAIEYAVVTKGERILRASS